MKTINNNKIDKCLYIIATPIGNLDDITIRAINTLKSVDLILCEDTRVSIKLLKHLNINKPLLAYHNYNEDEVVDKLVNLFNKHKLIALISDAGTPLINDPGYEIVKYCINNNINIIPIPGVSSIITSLVVSGFNLDKFLFLGFLPRKEEGIKKIAFDYLNYEGVIVFLESPNRINHSIKLLASYFPNSNFSIARELTKLHETIYYGNLSEEVVLPELGEYVICIDKTNTINKLDVKTVYTNYLKLGYSSNEAIKLTSKTLNISRNDIYKEIKC